MIPVINFNNVCAWVWVKLYVRWSYLILLPSCQVGRNSFTNSEKTHNQMAQNVIEKQYNNYPQKIKHCW